MKIEKIYIAGFGGLKDFTLELNSNFNVIFGENENGKTTVMNFIKAMFYGTGNKVKDLSKSIREKYRPWDDSVMAGRIYFEDSGKRYCLEREFKKTDSTDKITLTDADTKAVISTNTEVGPMFFGISAESFERSMFIGNVGSQSAVGDANGELGTKLSSLASTGEEDTSYGFVFGNLQNAKKKFTAKGKNAGAYSKDTENLFSLKEKLAKSKEQAEKYDELCHQISTLTENEQKSVKRLKTLKSVLDKKSDAENAKKLSEYINVCEDYEGLTKNLKFKDGSLVTTDFIKTFNFGLSKIEHYNQRIEDIKSDIERIKEKVALLENSNNENNKVEFKNAASEIENAESELKELESKKNGFLSRQSEISESITLTENSKKRFNPLLLIIGAVLFVLGAVFIPLKIVSVALAGIGIGLIFVILSFIIRPKNTKSLLKLQNEKSAVTNEIIAIESQISAVNSRLFAAKTKQSLLQTVLNSDGAAITQAKEELEVKLSQIEAENQKKENDIANLVKYYSKLGDETEISKITEQIAEISRLIEEIKPVKSKMFYLSEDLGGITKNDAVSKLESLDENNNQSVDFERVKAEYESLLKTYSETSADIAAKKAELKAAFSDYESPECIMRKIAEMQETIESEENFIKAIDIASDVLNDSFAELRRSYGSVLDKKALDIFSGLTDGRYNRMEISKSLDIKVERSDVFGTKEVEYLSAGTIDQAYLSLKLAVSSLLSDKKSLPVLLDDSLSQYDDRRMKKAMEFLKEYSENSQIIFFTCHNNIKDVAEKIGANTVLLKK